MSLSRNLRAFIGQSCWVVIALLLVLSGCQIRPLYSGVSPETVATIRFASSTNRIEQTVRNKLIFLLKAETAATGDARYQVTLSIGGSATSYLLSTATAETYPGRLIMEGSYTVADTDTGKIIHRSRQSLVALRDFTKQQYANIRATRDAEDRAANEMAERIRAEILSHLDSQGQWQK
jgi:LPS-assembly lipoprotein